MPFHRWEELLGVVASVTPILEKYFEGHLSTFLKYSQVSFRPLAYNHNQYSLGRSIKEEMANKEIIVSNENVARTAKLNLIGYLDSIIDMAELEDSDSIPSVARRDIKVVSSSVFIVHGHDEEMKLSVARTLEKLGLTPIILHEQPDGGGTIIEKFEKHSDVGFAVVLLSPDDMGYKKADGGKKAKPRARQNVILELGYFVGRLGRGKVMALKRGNDLEVPGDFDGVVYTPFDEHEGWQKKLVKELKAAGYDVDANAL